MRCHKHIIYNINIKKLTQIVSHENDIAKGKLTCKPMMDLSVPLYHCDNMPSALTPFAGVLNAIYDHSQRNPK